MVCNHPHLELSRRHTTQNICRLLIFRFGNGKRHQDALPKNPPTDMTTTPTDRRCGIRSGNERSKNFWLQMPVIVFNNIEYVGDISPTAQAVHSNPARLEVSRRNYCADGYQHKIGEDLIRKM
jgi:hypothetical protein